jgi:hypothetical protein
MGVQDLPRHELGGFAQHLISCEDSRVSRVSRVSGVRRVSRVSKVSHELRGVT